jgi:hypothetical protein
MGRPAKKWPHFALENLEDSVYRLKELERKASAVQDAIVLGDAVSALRDLSDVRVLALECVDNLVRARIGKYRQQDEQKEPQWTRADDQAAQAITQVLATRRQ